MRWLPEADVGQVWRFHYSEDEFYHCLLLNFHCEDDEQQYEVWNILDLDTAEAGRTTLGFFYEGMRGKVWWTRIT